MEEELKAILIRSIKRPKNLLLYFPLNNEDIYKEQLRIISKKIKKYGNGYLQNKDLVYYYKTFSFHESNITLFCIIYYYYSLKRKYIEKLSEEIYELIDIKYISENNELNNHTITKINDLFYKYLSIIRKDKGIADFCSGIEYIGEGDSSNDKDINSVESIDTIVNKRKNYSRIRNSKKSKDLGSTFNNTPFTETELTFMMKGYSLLKVLNIMKWIKSKKRWRNIFITISILFYLFLGFYFYFHLF